MSERGGSAAAGAEHLAPVRLRFARLPDRYTAVHAGPLAAHVVLLAAGRAFGLGRNDHAQLAAPDLRARRHPVALAPPTADREHVVYAACGRAHTLLVTGRGRVFGAGMNVFGQLGNGGRTTGKNPGVAAWQKAVLPPGEKVVHVAAGADFSVFCCESGAVFAAGSAQYGQLGNGKTGECIESSGRVAYDVVSTPVRVVFPEDVKITQVAAGVNHVVALDAQGKVWSWGFGGYGQLGHRKPGDELRPRKVDMFSGPNYKLDFVTAGASASFAFQRSRKSTYFWGVTKKSGESSMYPRPLADLQGWEVHAAACGQTSTVVAAENSVISWGPSPTYGELGYGSGPKSSTKPKIMDAVEGLEVKQVGVGLAFSVMLVNVKGDEMQKTFDKIEIVSEEGEVGSKRKEKNGSQAPTKQRAKKKRRR